MATGKLFSTEQTGIHKIDGILTGICAAINPATLALLLRASPIVTGLAKWCLNAAVLLNIPAIITLLWHTVRGPVRLQLMDERNIEACKAFADDLGHILESVALPAVTAEIMGPADENVINGPDGKDYLRMTGEQAKKIIAEGFARSLGTDNPIIAKSITVHAKKIFEAQSSALTAPLNEKFARPKHLMDLFSRRTRYWWFFGVLLAATGFVLALLNR